MFDGINYTTAPIILPYSYHPYAPAIADALAGVLQQAYFYARARARLVGIQTHIKSLNLQDFFFAAGNFGIPGTAFADVAQFIRQKPAWATHVYFEASFRLTSPGGAFVEHRIHATDGVTSADSSSFSQNLTPPTSPNILVFAPYDPTSNFIGVQRGKLDITGLSATRISVRVEAWAQNEDSSGVPAYYRSELCVAWFATEEV